MVNLLRIDGTGPARPLDDVAAAALIGGALDAVLGPLGGGGGGAAAGSSGQASSTAAATAKGAGAKAVWWGAGVAAVAAAGVAAWLLTRAPEQQRIGDEDPEAETVAVAVPETEAETVPEPVAAPEADAEPIELPAEDIDRTPKRDRSVTPTPEPPAKAEDLLAEANAARRRREWKEAERLYARVVKEHRGTGAAQVAQIASATIRLEHLGDPAGAAKRFKAALAAASSGPLAEEARYGLAEAYRALGSHAAEAKALAEFLRHHGDSPLADRARARRDALAKDAP